MDEPNDHKNRFSQNRNEISHTVRMSTRSTVGVGEMDFARALPGVSFSRSVVIESGSCGLRSTGAVITDRGTSLPDGAAPAAWLPDTVGVVRVSSSSAAGSVLVPVFVSPVPAAEAVHWIRPPPPRGGRSITYFSHRS